MMEVADAGVAGGCAPHPVHVVSFDEHLVDRAPHRLDIPSKTVDQEDPPRAKCDSDRTSCTRMSLSASVPIDTPAGKP